jgi:hypothetical protein
MLPPDTPGWKREPWVWLLIAIPLSAVVMGVVMISVASSTWSGLVVDDYYQQGKQINRVLERDRLAWELGLAASLRLEADDMVEIRFDPGVGFVPGDRIELALVHATRPGLDRRLVFDYAGGSMRAQLALPGEGRWNLFLQTPDWRLTGSLRYPQQQTAALLPNPLDE